MPLEALDGGTAASGTALDHSQSFSNDAGFFAQEDEC